VIKPKRMRWTGDVTYMEGVRDAYNISVRNSGGKRIWHRWKDNIKMDLK
jgi:hypothetical protein